MIPVPMPAYFTITERPGEAASAIQIEMLEARYRWATEQAGGKDVLEVACGAGIGLPVLAEVARSVRAGDPDAANLLFARTLCAGNPNIAVHALHAEKLPFASESFDLVLLFEAIYYLADVRRFLRETYRVLREGGTLLIVSVNPEWAGFNPSPLNTRYWSAAELLSVLMEESFAAGVQGAFPEDGGWAASLVGMLRRAAVALKLIPRTMRGKALLKRLFYGPTKAVPRLLVNSASSLRLGQLCDCKGDRHYRVLYATARKAIA